MSDHQQTGRSSAAELEHWIIAELAERLRLDPRAIDRRERFNRYGLDSVKATAFTVTLATRLGQVLPPTLMWDHPSVEKLVRHLTAPAATAPAGPAPAQRTPPARSAVLEPIAIVGLSCRFPQASDPAAYWRLLASGVDAIAEVPRDRWNLAELFDADPAVPGKMNTRWGGFLDQVDRFDAQAFGISPREAAQMDPQQRLILELCSEALDDAGVQADRLRGTATGVFIGAMWSDYARLVAGDASCITQHTATGQDTSIIAGRVSYVYGVQGPSLTVNTACSSSLVAVHLACQSLRLGESTLALVGGVSLVLSPESTVAMSKFGAMAADGRSKAFDARANGYVRGEGGGVLVLKPLSRALADGDSVYCVIAGSAMNNDGFSNGLTAPNPQAQEHVLRAAYANAGMPADQVQYVEAHGTGTLLGDPIEAGALGAVLGAGRPADRPLVLGSVKTNIGHLEAAAGMAGLIKVALSVRNGLIPPSLHFQTPNPHIRFNDLRLRVQTQLGPWPNEDEPPTAGVSSFGFGGTNCHVVVQGFAGNRTSLLTLTADDDADLAARAQALALRDDLAADAGHLRIHEATGRVRAAAVFSGPQDLRRKLAGLAAGTSLEGVAVGRAAGRPGGIVFVCSGHGSQWAGMTRSLMLTEPVFRARLEECSAAIEAVAGWNAIEELAADPAISRVEQFDITQPLLFAVSVSLAALWRSWGIEPDAVVGHSMGEVAAACVAGALSIDDAALVICHRSRLLGRMVGQGSIAILGLSREDVERKLAAYSDRVWVAACNGPTTTAVSGDPLLLQEIVAAMQAENQFARLANAGVPAHSPKVDPLKAELFESVHRISPRPNPVRMYSTVTAASIAGAQLGPSYWVRNLREPVLFAQAVEAALRDGCDTFVELSPHPVLSTGIEQSLAKAGVAGVVLPSGRRHEDERRVMLETAARLFASGHELTLNDDARRAEDTVVVPVVLSAYTPAALRASARGLAGFVRDHREVGVLDVAQTTTRRRTHHEHRAALVAATREALIDGLEAFARDEERAHTSVGRAGDAVPRVAFVFCGHGPQWWAMGRELSAAEPEFREAIERCDRLIKRHADWSLVEELGRDEPASRLDRLDIAQPAIFSMQVALAALWKSWGVTPEMVIGHSMGEVAAAHAAGVLSLDDAVRVIVQRGRLVQQGAGRGRMAAVELSAADAAALIEPYGDRVAVAAVNGPAATVLSGEPAAIAELVRTVEARGVFGRELRVDFASHCAQMDPLVPQLVSMLDGIAPAAAAVPIYSTVTGAPADGWEFDAPYWGRNTRQPVLFAQAFDAMLAAGVDVVIEIGPHPVLAAAMADCARPREQAPVLLASLRRDQPERASMLGSAGALHTRGYELAWQKILPPGGRAVPLPPYPWQRERHWLGPVRRTVTPVADSEALPADIDRWFYDVSWRPFDAQAAGQRRSASWMPMPADLNPAVEAGRNVPPASAAPIDRVRDLALGYAANALSGAGVQAGEHLSLSAFAGRFGVVEAQTRMFNRVLEVLASRGAVEKVGEEWVVRALPPAQDTGALAAALRAQSPAYGPELTLLDRCGRRLRSVLRGECDPLDLLFPDGSTADAERLYEQSTFSRCHNEQIRSALGAIATRKPAGRRLRVLEIGAGTGATTRYALEALPEGAVEYVFTDASPMFLARAKEKFGHRSDVAYEPLDIEQDPVAQGFPAGTFDVVIAANVLHATRDLRRTLAHVSTLIADAGLVMLLEGVKPEFWVDLIFGLTPGWWKFADRDLRPAHALLTGDQWTQTLAESGFTAAEICADRTGESLFAQAVILGRAPVRAVTPAAGRDWLVLADGRAAGDEFAAARRGAGDRATVVVRPASGSFGSLPELENGWGTPALDRHVVYVCAPDAAETTDAPESSALDRCAEVLGIAQRLIAAGAGAPRLWIVTRGAQRVAAGDVPSVDQAPLWGLARVLALEHPQVWGGIVDVANAAAGPAAAAAIAGRAGAEDQIAVRGEAEYVARLVETPRRAGQPLKLDAEATYLVTGGLGNLGVKVARWMVARGARHLVLAGRSARNAAAVHELEASGATVEVARGDVSDAGWTVALVERLAAGTRPLKGIIHAAGVSVRKPLAELGREDFETDFAPKVNGAWLLHRATCGLPLDFFVMFSSAAAIWASRDMASYAAANHFLDALAQYRRGLGLPALSINWGRWDEVGVTTADAHALWDRIGLRPMPETAALEALERLMVSGAANGTVADVEWSRFKSLHETRAVRPFLEEVGCVPAAQISAAPAPAENLQAVLDASSPEERLKRLSSLVHREVCSILGLDPARPLDPARGFAQMGLDSLMAIDLRNRLQKALGRSLPSPVVFNYPNVRALAGYLGGGESAASAAAAKAQAPASAAPRSLAANEINELSDEEAEALLATRVAALGRDGA